MTPFSLHTLRFRLCWLALTALILLACKNSLPAGESPVSGPEKITMSCYYLGGEKYLEDQRDIDYEAWKREIGMVQGELAPPRPPRDLFDHQGGGPAGAEWNSDGDLVLRIHSSIPAEQIGELRILLNGKPFSPAGETDFRPPGATTNLWVRLPSAEWLSALAPIRKSDYPLLYGQETMDNFAGQEGSPLGVGRILRIRVEVQVNQSEGIETLVLERAFHRAEGE